MKNKKLTVNLLIIFIVTVIFAVTCGLNLFEKLDLSFYNGLLHLKKNPPLSDKVMMVTIDEDDINEIGDWPWTRDILGNALLRMKQLGAKNAVFDIEYISPSLKGVASNAETKINNRIYQTENVVKDLFESIPSVLNQGYTINDIPKFYNDYVFPEYSELYDFVNNNVAADNDEYFSKCAQFFGNTWLTVNNNELKYDYITQDKVDYIRNRMLVYSVEDPKHRILKDNDYEFKKSYFGIGKGFTPALHTMMMRATGAGFTNSNVDSDGVRRRMELLYEYDNKYLPQLVFGPFLRIVDSTRLTRTNNALIVHDALLPGQTQRKDIKIPLDDHGCMLINFQHAKGVSGEKVDGLPFVHVTHILHLNQIEENLINDFNTILSEYSDITYNNDLLEYYYHAQELVDFYQKVIEYKTYLLSKCTGFDVNNKPYDGISDEEYEQYFTMYSNFYDYVLQFIQTDYMKQYEPVFEEFSAQVPEFEQIKANLSQIFENIQKDYSDYVDLYGQLQQKLDGTCCILGMTAASTTDIGAVPFNKQYYNVGIHTNVLNTLLTEDFIKQGRWFWGLIITCIAYLLLLFTINLSNSKVNIISGSVSAVLIISFILLFVVFSIYTPMVGSVLLYNIVLFLSGAIYRYINSSREKRFITQIASSFANKDTVEQLRKNPESFKTEGQKKVITALFSDIQKFSTFSEKINQIYGAEGPNKLIELLNEYLGAMSNEILKNNGNIDKYEGDAIISMFGAPDPMNLHNPNEWAYCCLDSAIRMKKCEVEFNESHKFLFEPVKVKDKDGNDIEVKLNPFQTRIGINTGNAFVGLMGSKTDSFSKLNYTMIGDTVNLASRLEGVNKAYASWIMCSDDTWNLANTGANEGKITVRRLDKVRVVGRSTPVQLYNIVGFTEELTDKQKKMLETFDKALDKYLNKEFIEAGKLFVQCSKILGEEDATSLIFAERCKNFAEKGVPSDWDGVMNMTSK